jgi:hypothetical protein
MNAEAGHKAGMSVVLVTDHFSTIARVVRQLAAQTVHDQLEIVIVCSTRQALEPDQDALSGFASVVVEETGTLHPLPAARAAGVRAANAPIVFLGETHSYPHPDFAALLMAAHRAHWDVVIPGFDNANEDGILSWAAFLADYGYWLHYLPEGRVGAAPTWNVAYKRSSLVDLGDNLASALANGDELASAFRARGRVIYFLPAARLDHANVSRRFREWIDERYLSGLLVGANRRSRWPLHRRWLHILASPLIPVVLLKRIAPAMRSARSRGRLPSFTLAALIAGVVIRSCGEFVGYLAGVRDDQEERMEEYELHKLKYTRRPPG